MAGGCFVGLRLLICLKLTAVSDSNEAADVQRTEKRASQCNCDASASPLQPMALRVCAPSGSSSSANMALGPKHHTWCLCLDLIP